MKKIVTILLAVVAAVTCCFGLAACGGNNSDTLRVGLIALHDSNSTYDKNFIDAFEAACKAQGVEAVIRTQIPEDETCKTAAMDLADDGCKLVFADSFGHEPFLREAAAQYPDVEFCHATGTTTQTDKSLTNFHNAFASIYEGRYLAGVAAGVKLKTMYEADNSIAKDGVITVGYVGAFPYAEVKSGYTSWLLGVRKAFDVENITVNMIVEFTNSWYDETLERNAANSLIEKGCVIISQHADSWGAPKACETAGVPNVSYNGSTASQCPNTFIISSRINWQPYFEYIIECVKNGTEIAADWVQGLGETFDTGSVCLSELGTVAPAAGTMEVLEEVAAGLRNGTIKVFDTSTFTLSEYKSVGNGFPALTDVVIEGNRLVSAKQNGVEVVKTENGITYFNESAVDTNRSAPYFDMDIDGITLNLAD